MQTPYLVKKCLPEMPAGRGNPTQKKPAFRHEAGGRALVVSRQKAHQPVEKGGIRSLSKNDEVQGMRKANE